MSQATKLKTIARSKLTKAKNKLDQVLQTESSFATPDDFVFELNDALADFETKFSEFEFAENEFFLTLEEKDRGRGR